MAILDVIEWANAGPTEIVRRVPASGSGEFRLGSQLIVRDYQTAVFYSSGQAQDRFDSGRYTLSTENIPLLADLLSIPFGGKSPFRTEVFFVSQRTFLDLKWGTPQPLALRDPDLGLVRLRAFGTFALQVADPALLVTKLVGGQGMYSTQDVVGWLRNAIVSRFADQLGELQLGLFDLPAHYDELGAALAARTREDFAAVGLDLRALYVTSINTTDETQKAIDERAAMGAIGDVDKYLRYKAAQGLGVGGAAEGGVAAGVGLGAGAGLGAALAQSLIAAAGQPPVAPAPLPSAGDAGAAGPAATVETDFGRLRTLVKEQLAVPATERAEIGAALERLQAAVGAPQPDLRHIREERAATVQRWPWLAEPLATLFGQPALQAALAAAAASYLDVAGRDDDSVAG